MESVRKRDIWLGCRALDLKARNGDRSRDVQLPKELGIFSRVPFIRQGRPWPVTLGRWTSDWKIERIGSLATISTPYAREEFSGSPRRRIRRSAAPPPGTLETSPNFGISRRNTDPDSSITTGRGRTAREPTADRARPTSVPQTSSTLVNTLAGARNFREVWAIDSALSRIRRTAIRKRRIRRSHLCRACGGSGRRSAFGL
jgi:hypothetical protein